MPLRIPRHSCSGCDSRWDGCSTCHCASAECHRTFTGITAWEAHRAGTHAKGRYCLDPSDAGLVSSGRSYPCWALPGHYEREEK